ncbi:hypothetical protein BJV77DRAFT_1020843 [Russula vinacea]|nr:hypothetical protein BJV77DRAFT_1020843 [Russula vinacea]
MAVPSGTVSSSKSAAKTKRTGVSRRIQGRLQNMLSLPFDVLFLIFSELGPMDLVNLARTNKALRQVLMSRKSIWVWLVARRNAGATKVPDPPDDMSEPAWALLLFGPAVCSQCSTKNIHRVDFALRRRLCTVCRKNFLVPAIKFRYQCSGLNESVMDLVPHTKIGGWAHRRLSSSRFYWRPDLVEMGERLAELEADVDRGIPGAQERLELFREQRKLLVDSIIQSCAKFEEWAKTEADAQTSDARERRAQRRKALKDRILAAGYDSADIDSIGMSAVPGANVNKILTEEAWKRIKTKVENRLSDAREARLHAERCRREREHRAKAEQCYIDILRQVLPVQRLYLPSISQARELSCFRELLDPDRDVQPAEWVHAAGRLRESLSEWMSSHRDRCTRLLSSHFHGSRGKSMEVRLLTDPSTVVWRHVGMHNFAGRLELATSVFRHPGTNMILIGRNACHAWKITGELEFLERGADATHALLRELQLDPATTTPSNLDLLNRRFICASCPADLEWIDRSWRSCVSHFVESSETSHPYPQWRLVSPDEVVMRGETFDDSIWYSPRFEKTDTWLCNHCSDYLAPTSHSFFGRFLRAGSKWDAIWHVQTEHNVEDPLVDVDVFSYPMFVTWTL